jgi:hypothetical protein
MNRILAAASACALLSATAAFADTRLPTFGHYIGYGIVAAATADVCGETVGTTFMNQLELNTPVNRLVAKTRRVFYGSGGPYIEESVFDKTSGTELSPSGTVKIRQEGVTGTVAGSYTATYTPLDPNSFAGNVTVTYTPDGQSSPCVETHQIVFVRSSAD